MLTHVGVFSVDFSRIDTGKTVCFLVSGGLYTKYLCRRVFSAILLVRARCAAVFRCVGRDER